MKRLNPRLAALDTHRGGIMSHLLQQKGRGVLGPLLAVPGREAVLNYRLARRASWE